MRVHASRVVIQVADADMGLIEHGGREMVASGLLLPLLAGYAMLMALTKAGGDKSHKKIN